MDDLVERLRAMATLPLCPYDRRSPDYWTTDTEAPCKVCGQLNDFNAPDLCRGADTRLFTQAADALQASQAREGQAVEALRPFAGSIAIMEALAARAHVKLTDDDCIALSHWIATLGEEGDLEVRDFRRAHAAFQALSPSVSGGGGKEDMASVARAAVAASSGVKSDSDGGH